MSIADDREADLLLETVTERVHAHDEGLVRAILAQVTTNLRAGEVAAALDVLHAHCLLSNRELRQIREGGRP